MLKVTALQRTHTTERSEKRTSEGKHATHTHSKTSCFKPSVAASRMQTALLRLLSKTLLSFQKCVCVCMRACVCVRCLYYGFRLFLNLAITGHSWHLDHTTVLSFPSNLSPILTALTGIPSVTHITTSEWGRRPGGSRNRKGLCWNWRKYEWRRGGRTAGGFQVGLFWCDFQGNFK